VILTALIFLFIYYQPSISYQFIAASSCRLIGDTEYIKSNVNKECYTSEYNIYSLAFILPILLTVVFLIPYFMYYSLSKKKNNLKAPSVLLTYGLLYNEYKERAYFWEFIKMTQKVMIIIFLNFYETHIKTKGLFIFILIIIYGIMSAYS